MNKYKFTAFILLSIFSITGLTENLEEFVVSIKTVKVAKSELKSAFSTLDNCQVGSCANETSTLICDIVGALDVNFDGKIIGEMSGGETSKNSISANDLHYMKEIFSQCKPTNYQYWNYEKILHVGYRPTNKSDVKIRKYLGIKPNK